MIILKFLGFFKHLCRDARVRKGTMFFMQRSLKLKKMYKSGLFLNMTKKVKKVPNSRRELQSIVILRSPKAIGFKSFGDFVEPTAFRAYFLHRKVKNIHNKAVSRACRSEVSAFFAFFARYNYAKVSL